MHNSTAHDHGALVSRTSYLLHYLQELVGSMKAGRMKTVTSRDNTTIAFDVVGNGPPLILISGAICFRNFKPILDDVKKFSSRFQVYNYDRRGRGDSTDHQTYSIEKEVDDLEALMNHIGEKVQIYGHSSGGVLALEVSMRMPEKISKIVVYDPPYVPDQKEKIEYAKLRRQIKDLIDNKSYAKALRTFLIGIGMPKFFAYLLPLMPGWKTMKALAPTLNYDLELTHDVPPVERLSKIKVPTKIVYGEKSPPSIHQSSKIIGMAIPSAELIVIQGQDHMVNANKILPLL